MNKTILICIIGLFFIGTNLYAANGDLIVNGKLGVGTSSPGAPVTIAPGNPGYAWPTALSIQPTTYPGSTRAGMVMGHWGLGQDIFCNGGNNFYIWNDADATTKLLIDSAGRVGIGVTNPSYQLQLSTDSAYKLSTSTWSYGSDERLKKDIIPFTDGLSVIRSINPVRYKYNGKGGIPASETERENIGVLAQDIQIVAPYTVGKFKAKLNKEDSDDTELLSFNPHALFFVLINAVKEQQQQIADLQQQVVDLKKMIK